MPAHPTPVRPPGSALQKLAFYGRKYGLVSSVARFAGRKSYRVWRWIGPVCTAGHLRRWLANPGDLILNLGGGGNCLAECFTVDIDARADAYVDVTRPLPMPECSVAAIFCEEVIEHVDLPAGRRLLAECFRILRPGGMLRLTTPDLGYFARRVLADPAEPAEINSIFFGHGHRHLYTQESLTGACLATGFVNPRPSRYQDPESKLGWLDSHADRFGHLPEISQYLEVSRPSE
jgi:predicted SAM-dependent methyltransferase